jgi:hypothetical protein
MCEPDTSTLVDRRSMADNTGHTPFFSLWFSRPFIWSSWPLNPDNVTSMWSQNRLGFTTSRILTST